VTSPSVHSLTAPQIKNWHRSNIAIFILLGMGFTAMATRMPLVKADLGVTASQLGLILLATGLGSLGGLNLVGWLIARWGTRRWILWMFPVFTLDVFVGAIFVENHFTLGYVFTSVLSGFVMGMVDVANNVDGTALEKATNRILMPRMHAGYSIGTLIAAGWGALSSAIHLSLTLMLLPIVLAQLALPFVVHRYLPHDAGVEAKHSKTNTHSNKPTEHWFSFVLVLLGIGILCMTVSEGAATDWLTLGIKSGYSVTEATAGVSFMLFFGGMVLVRLYGGHLADRIGKGRALQLLAAVGVLGLVMNVLGAPNLIFSWIGSVLWGAGVALGFPLFLSAAGEGENAAKRVSFVATWGYGSLLCGPPLLGFVADALGLLNMFYVIAGFLALALLVAGAAGKRPNAN